MKHSPCYATINWASLWRRISGNAFTSAFGLCFWRRDFIEPDFIDFILLIPKMFVDLRGSMFRAFHKLPQSKIKPSNHLPHTKNRGLKFILVINSIQKPRTHSALPLKLARDAEKWTWTKIKLHLIMISVLHAWSTLFSAEKFPLKSPVEKRNEGKQEGREGRVEWVCLK